MNKVEAVRKLVRPFIAVSIICMLGYGVYTEIVEAKDLMIIVSMVIGFYFGERAGLKRPGDDAN